MLFIYGLDSLSPNLWAISLRMRTEVTLKCAISELLRILLAPDNRPLPHKVIRI